MSSFKSLHDSSSDSISIADILMIAIQIKFSWYKFKIECSLSLDYSSAGAMTLFTISAFTPVWLRLLQSNFQIMLAGQG